MADSRFDEWVAERYERLWPELFVPEVLEPAVAFLTVAAGDGPVLELGIGTGRVAVPLSRGGLRVHGIELSPAMVAHLRHRSAEIEVTVGDFATADAGGGPFALAYLVRNTITNLTSQDEQVECFRNVARQLRPGGVFVIENYVPQLRPGERIHVFTAVPEHLGFEEYDDPAGQTAVSHHYWTIDGQLRTFASRHRYVWPSELDLMARLAGLTSSERWSDWHRTPFTGESRSHISVWQKPPSTA